MATFCVKCGSPLAESAAFCGKCGNSSTLAAPVAKSSSALKIIIILLCCLFVGGIVVVGAVAYVAHRVKQAVVQKAAENGVDLNSLATTNSEPTRALSKPCTLLSKQEVSRLIGQPIERAEIKDQTCEYYGPAGLSAKLAQQEGASVMERAKTQSADPKMNAMEV
jgi:hypothetical protein